jgi:hypothetical protein
MFDLFYNSKVSIFRWGMIGLIIGALINGAYLSIPTFLSDDRESQPYWLLAAILGGLIGSVPGAIIGITIGTINYSGFSFYEQRIALRRRVEK